MTSTGSLTLAPATDSDRPTTKGRHRKPGLPSVGLRAAVRNAPATTARHAHAVALASRVHLNTTEAQR